MSDRWRVMILKCVFVPNVGVVSELIVETFECVLVSNVGMVSELITDWFLSFERMLNVGDVSELMMEAFVTCR